MIGLPGEDDCAYFSYRDDEEGGMGPGPEGDPAAMEGRENCSDFEFDENDVYEYGAGDCY